MTINEVSKQINDFIKQNLNVANTQLSILIEDAYKYKVSPDAVSKRKAIIRKKGLELEDELQFAEEEEFLNNDTENIDEENEQTIDAITNKKLSPEEFLKEHNIDENEWILKDYTMGYWGSEEKPNYKIIAKLSKRDVSISGVLQPVNLTCTFTPTLPQPVIGDGIKQALIIPDSQNGYKRNPDTGHLEPYHDRLAWDLAIQMAKEIQPHKIVLLGDMLDLPEWSDKFIRSPEFNFVTQPALVELVWWLGKLKLAAPNAEIFYLEGNHEKRMNLLIQKNFPMAYNLKQVGNDIPVLSIPFLLGLDKLNIKYIGEYPDGELWLNDNLSIVHGAIAKATSGATAKAMVDESRCSVIFGHIHRRELVCKTQNSNRGKICYTAFTPGCICRIDGTVPGSKSKSNWQQGLAIVHYEEGNGYFDIQQIAINNGLCIYNNQVWQGAFDITELANETDRGEFLL